MEDATTPVHSERKPPPARVAMLVGRSPQVAGEVFVIEAPAILGRDADVSLPMVHDGVSRRHAEIVRDADDALNVRDLGSTNGTIVNGAPISTHRLANGDRIQIGTVELEYRLATEPESRRVRESAAAATLLSRLSERELEVARLVAQGLKSDEIGRRLHIATRTVNTHLEHIYGRLEIKSRAVLTRLVTQADLGT